ncbi:PucR family transcriptional regulator [Rhodococcus ruber]|uniref:PucR family transcriptional regulator n=1 Tax=Rhodococcus ruber TaxID=1830 RepID=A0ABT4MEB4_9NOCA|nr:PucR family transcriptional regulator [Rhodococcus ruber]MCZ4519329.1 PucR family transcriptional regulator [Rhodococcus ruber]
MSTIYGSGMWQAASVASILELEIFQRSGAFLAAGEGGLDRLVRWVHSGESSDIAKFLSGGELLLTSGQGIGSTSTDQRRFIAALADVGVSALAIELAGRAFTEVPHAVVEEADRLNLPIIGLPIKIPFVEASAQVLQQLTDIATKQYARSDEINRFLIERLLTGADSVALVHDFAGLLNRPIVLESIAHEIQAYYGGDERGAQGDIIADWQTHSRAVDIHSPDAAPESACRRVPIVLQGTEWGALHLPALGQVDNRMDHIALDHAASAIAISLLNSKVTRVRSAHHQGVLVNRLMVGDLSGTGFVQRALQIGQDLRGKSLIVADIGSKTRSTDKVQTEIVTALRDRNFPAVIADVGQSILAVIALKDATGVNEIAELLGDPDRCIGFSKIAQASELPAAVDQARAAASTRQPIQYFDDLGLLRLLVSLASGPELDQYVEEELGPLLDAETANDKGLLETLTVYLDCDGNKSDAAAKLFVHRRSLYYRLEKIERILGKSLEDHETRLRLNVAVRSLSIVRAPQMNRHYDF